MRHEDEDRERIDEAGNDRAADELHQQVEPGEGGNGLENAHQDRGCEQIFDTMIADQWHHHHGNSCGRCRDHPRPASDKRDHNGNGYRGIKAHARIDPGNDREADRFGNQGKGNDDACKNVSTRIGEPVAVKRGS